MVAGNARRKLGRRCSIDVSQARPGIETKIIEGPKTGHDIPESCRDYRISRVCVERPAFDGVLVHCRLECRLDLPRLSAEGYPSARPGHFIHSETLSLKPRDNLIHVVGAQSKAAR